MKILTDIQVHKLRQEYRETIQAASDKLREGIKNVKADIFRAKLAEYKETLGRIGNIYRYSVENGLTARETAQECLDSLMATSTRSHRVDDAAIERLIHNVREHAFSETLRQYVLTNVDIEGCKKRIKQLEAKPVRHDANEEVAQIYAQEDIFISAIEMVANVGKEGVTTLKERFPDFFEALENKVQQT
ncbi:hypothetical protein HG530_015725 [Fusarium avenaceum]|nr:hypothetical protein HG530_015725 [Fusarium avenaceum]